MNWNYLRKNKRKIVVISIFAFLLAMLIFDFNRFTSIVDWSVNVFKPLFIGGCIAFALNLLMETLNERIFNHFHFKKSGTKDAIALFSSVILLIVIVVLLLWFVIPQLIQALRLVVEAVPSAIDYLRNLLESLLQKYPGIVDTLRDSPIKAENIASNLVSYLQHLMSGTINQTYNIATNVIGTVFTIFVSIMFSFFLLLYKDKLGRQCRQLLYSYLSEKTANQTLYVFHLAYKNFNAFIVGQVLGALIQFGLYLVISLILRIPYSLMIAVIIMIFSLIPMFGSYIAYVLAVLLIVSVKPVEAIYFSIVFFIVCNIEGNIIYPRIIGSTIGLPGIWVLAAVTVGANMFGILGMIFSVPVVAMLYTLLSEDSQKILKNRPEVIDKITKPPEWKYYNYQTEEFEKEPVVTENVLETGKAEEESTSEEKKEKN